MNLLNGLLVVLCLVFITTVEGQRIRSKENNPLATLQRLSPSIFGRSELSEEETETITSDASTSKPATGHGTSSTKIPKHEDNLGIAKFLDSLNFDHIDKAIENLKVPDFKK